MATKEDIETRDKIIKTLNDLGYSVGEVDGCATVIGIMPSVLLEMFSTTPTARAIVGALYKYKPMKDAE